MPFPSTWLQTWQDFPDLSGEPHRALCSWFQITGVAVPPILTGDIDLTAACQQYHDNLFSIVRTPFAGVSCPGRWYYWPAPGGGVLPYLYGQWDLTVAPAVEVLPTQKCAIIRRETGGFGKSDRGKISLCCLSPDFVERGHLTLLGFAILRNAALRVTDAFTVRGQTFMPALCSYKNATLTPLIGATARQRLGTVVRRSRIPTTRVTTFGLPKPPPP